MLNFIEDNLFISPTPIKLAEEVAGWFYLQLTDSSKPHYVAISGGSTPVLFFNSLAAKYGPRINWKNIHIFWADEKCVPPSNNESNFKVAKVHLLSKIDIPENNIHRIKGEEEPNVEVKRYTEEILSVVPHVNDLPCFDIVLLGMGSDGHVASIFEGQENVIFSGNIVEMAYNPENNQRRITLTPYCINNANKVAFQISGLVKANIIKEILNNGSKSHIYPAKQIKPSNGDLYWFLDSGAASGLIIKD